jgi:hypothetical protein
MRKRDDRASIRDHFVGWQCQLRQEAMRLEGGRPSPGMRPRVTRQDGSEIAPAITVLLVEKEPEATTDLFRHIVRKTHDSRQRYEEGVRMLSSAYYQYPDSFSGVLTGLFSADSALAAALREDGRCVLHFRQGGQSYRIPCDTAELRPKDTAFQATYWHNHLFNPTPPSRFCLLAFYPDWAEATASIPE